jgi:hypothetical protein
MNDERKVVLADLHIHTPESKCFKDEKSDKSYIGILKEAKKKELSIIAITDHNSIEGYRKLIEIKGKYEEELIYLDKIKDSKQVLERSKLLQSHLRYFQDLLIIPGVEFEVNNGVHILCLFNPDTPVQEIEEFINNGGYGVEDYGVEKVRKISKWSIFQFFEETKRYDCIVIDAHTDSDKGILQTFDKGLPRAHCLSNPQLDGLCYKSENQRSLLEKTFETSIEYQREIPLAFLKSSDAHKISEVGKDTTYFQLKEINFSELKKAFSNPLEYISTTIPEVTAIVKKIIATGKYLSITSLAGNKLKESLCAFNNSTGGYIMLGISDMGGFDGFANEEAENVFGYVKESLNSLKRKIEFQINPYPIKNDKFILIVNVKKGDQLIDVDNEGIIWVYDSKKIRRLSAEEIERNIENKVTSQLQVKIVKRLLEIETQSLEIKNSLFSFPIIQKFEQNSIKAYSIINRPNYSKPLKLSIEQDSVLKEYVKNKENGKSKGNIFYFKDLLLPRFDYAYLRLSIPKYYLKGITNHTKKDEHLIVLPGGRIFYSNKKIEHYNEDGIGIVEFSSKDENYSNKFLACFLKSSFFLWYFNFKYDSFDLIESKKFRKIPLPIIHKKNPTHKYLIEGIENLFDLILERENEFLKLNFNHQDDGSEEVINDHNMAVENLFYEIDELIYKLINLNDDEIDIIESSLNANNIYVPNR